MSRVVREVWANLTLTGPGVVAVSGGADSVALLRALVEADAGPLTVAHFDHRLRGEGSAADAGFVRELAAGLGLPFRLGGADVADAARGDNLEATARRLRYGWLAEVAAEVAATWVATGHTADDQAETVLHRLIRGTGLQGLRGIAGERELADGIDLIRPLLTVTRAEVLDYLADLGQPFREDATNADRRFTRNRIRAELLPLLKTFNPAVVDALGRLADQAADAATVMECQAAQLLRRIESPRAGPVVVLDIGRIVPTSNRDAPDEWVHPHLLREACRLLWDREGWPRAGMTAAHWTRLAAVALGDPPAADFPGGVWARRVGRVVQLGRRE